MVNGTLAERLGSGLQHHLQRFESARYLFKIPKLLFKRLGIFLFNDFQTFSQQFLILQIFAPENKNFPEKLRSF